MGEVLAIASTNIYDTKLDTAGVDVTLDSTQRRCIFFHPTVAHDVFLPSVVLMVGKFLTIYMVSNDNDVAITIKPSILDVDCYIYVSTSSPITSFPIFEVDHHVVLYCDGHCWIQMEGYRDVTV